MTFNATGTPFDQERPVFKLDIVYTQLDKSLRFIYRWLSQRLSRIWMEPVLLLLGPKVLLPNTVILKQRVDKDEGTIAAFHTEEHVYTTYQHLQGSLMPYYYGKALCGTIPALVFSQAEGKALHELSSEEKRRALPVIERGYEELSDDLALLDMSERVRRMRNQGYCLDIKNDLLATIKKN
ncbi:kinase-like domain protein [Venturia nashicola]|uniref:Kinase-like domain protein n=1 Tax=Venturia nashicola TaxID=86259 RepID=A0A4Z1NQ21_9PEZI|nr:kinase-like domain protein [Venturia nashicola]